MTPSTTAAATAVNDPPDLALLADQLKLLALNAAVDMAATDDGATAENVGLLALEGVLGDIEGALSRRPATAEDDAALIQELSNLSRTLSRTVTALEE